MRLFVFIWSQPANEVYVTGSFDNWSKSVQLEKVGGSFSKRVELPNEKITYKFIVDGNWTTDSSAPIETEPSGVQNNILLPLLASENVNHAQEMYQAHKVNVTPDSTTAMLAGAVPKESEKVASEMPTPDETSVPGGFPDTPAIEKTEQATIGSNADSSAPVSKENAKLFSIKPLPASDTFDNPISLKPGEPIPQNITTQTIHSNVRLDKESYERGATNYPLNNFILPEVVTPAEKRAAEGKGVLDIPTITGNMPPGSSLPGAFDENREAHEADHRSTGEQATTTEHVGSAVSNIQEQASTAAIQAKDSIAPVARQAAEQTSSVATHAKDQALPVVNEAAQKAISAATVAKDQAYTSAVQAKEQAVPAINQAAQQVGSMAMQAKEQSVPVISQAVEQAGALAEQAKSVLLNAVTNLSSKAPQIGSSKGVNETSPIPAPAESVPEVVKESIAEAGVPAEAAGVPQSVALKERLESELKRDVPETEPAVPAGLRPAETVPQVVKESIAEAGSPAEAASVSLAVENKEVVEEELKGKVPLTEPVSNYGTKQMRPLEPVQPRDPQPWRQL